MPLALLQCDLAMPSLRGGVMDKEDVVYIYIQWSITQPKKSEIMPFAATWMDLEIIILSEVSQAEKDKCHMISFICGI